MHPVESGVEVGRWHRAFEHRERAVVQFHADSIECRQRGFDLDQVEDYRLVWAEHLARGNTEQQGITDLAGCTGHRNTYGFFTHKKVVNIIRDTVHPDKVFRLAKRFGEIAR